MYKIRYQKLNKNDRTPANGAYSTDEYDDVGAFMEGVVETAQNRVRGYKYRHMDVTVDGGDVALRFDWQATGNVKD